MLSVGFFCPLGHKVQLSVGCSRINISIWAEGAMKQSHLNLRKNGLYKTVPVNNPYVIKVK